MQYAFDFERRADRIARAARLPKGLFASSPELRKMVKFLGGDLATPRAQQLERALDRVAELIRLAARGKVSQSAVVRGAHDVIWSLECEALQ
jgi:hypothetical protein